MVVPQVEDFVHQIIKFTKYCNTVKFPSNIKIYHLPPPPQHTPTMIKYGIKNIHELVGHKVNVEMVHNNPLC